MLFDKRDQRAEQDERHRLAHLAEDESEHGDAQRRADDHPFALDPVGEERGEQAGRTARRWR